jgi:hypothetical protein
MDSVDGPRACADVRGCADLPKPLAAIAAGVLAIAAAVVIVKVTVAEVRYARGCQLVQGVAGWVADQTHLAAHCPPGGADAD